MWRRKVFKSHKKRLEEEASILSEERSIRVERGVVRKSSSTAEGGGKYFIQGRYMRGKKSISK